MKIGLSIVTQEGHYQRTLAAVQARYGKKDVNEVLGRTASEFIRKHLEQYNAENPNKLGGKRTNFFRQAAKAISFLAGEDEVDVKISMLGLRQQWRGGPITPGKNASYSSGGPTRLLTIPAIAAAHGKRAGEFDNLDLVMFSWFGKDFGDLEGMLVERTKTKLLVKGGKRAKRKKSALEQRGKAVFWLVSRAVTKPHPGVLPTQEELHTALIVRIWKMHVRPLNN